MSSLAPGQVLVTACCQRPVTVWGTVDMAYHGAKIVVDEDGDRGPDFDSVYDTSTGDATDGEHTYTCLGCSNEVTLASMVPLVLPSGRPVTQ